ncbi:MAG: hypothetical protein QXN16_03595 [Candidatus Micrarchaeaceae archaeon]
MENFVVSSMKLSGGIYAFAGKMCSVFECKESLLLYDKITANGEVKLVSHKGKTAYLANIKKLAKPKHIEYSNNELGMIAKKMDTKLKKAAKELIAAFFSGAPISVRFHGDGDGAAGAVALYSAFMAMQNGCNRLSYGIRWAPQRGIAYTYESMYSDLVFFKGYKSIEKPKIVIIDFGTTPQSNEAIEGINKNADIIWLDHHPIAKGFLGEKLDFYINPVQYGGSSDFTAGYLACLFAEMLGSLDANLLKEASLISDVSRYANKANESALKAAVVLDFITGIKPYTGYLDGEASPAYMYKLLGSKDRVNNVYRYATDMMEDAINIGESKAKRYKGISGIEILVINFAHMTSKYAGYLLPGRYSSRLHEELEKKGKECITIVYFRNSISIRISRNIAKDVKVLDIIDTITKDKGILNGGGHESAASIVAVDEAHAKDALKKLLEYLGVKK